MVCVTSSSGFALSELPAPLGTGLGVGEIRTLMIRRVHNLVSLSPAVPLPDSGERPQSQLYPDSFGDWTQFPPL